MRTYARIDGEVVAELISTDGDISQMFNSEMAWVDVTNISPEPEQHWSAAMKNGNWSFAAPAVVVPTLEMVQADLCASIDAAADKVYIAIGGPSPGRLNEYEWAEAEAEAFKTAGYVGDVPESLAIWVQASGWSAQQACDNILSTAAEWKAARAAVRQRLVGKANVNNAVDMASAQAAANEAISSILSVLPVSV